MCPVQPVALVIIIAFLQIFFRAVRSQKTHTHFLYIVVPGRIVALRIHFVQRLLCGLTLHRVRTADVALPQPSGVQRTGSVHRLAHIQHALADQFFHGHVVMGADRVSSNVLGSQLCQIRLLAQKGQTVFFLLFQCTGFSVKIKDVQAACLPPLKRDHIPGIGCHVRVSSGNQHVPDLFGRHPRISLLYQRCCAGDKRRRRGRAGL